MDMNFFPQAAGLNRSTSERGKVWRAMERYTTDHPGAPLFVHPSYDGETWISSTIDYGLLADDKLWLERFENRD